MKFRNTEMNKEETEWAKKLKNLIETMPNTLVFSVNQFDDEISLMKRTYYGASGVMLPLKVRYA